VGGKQKKKKWEGSIATCVFSKWDQPTNGGDTGGGTANLAPGPHPPQNPAPQARRVSCGGGEGYHTHMGKGDNLGTDCADTSGDGQNKKPKKTQKKKLLLLRRGVFYRRAGYDCVYQRGPLYLRRGFFFIEGRGVRGRGGRGTKRGEGKRAKRGGKAQGVLNQSAGGGRAKGGCKIVPKKKIFFFTKNGKKVGVQRAMRACFFVNIWRGGAIPCGGCLCCAAFVGSGGGVPFHEKKKKKRKNELAEKEH